MSENIAMSISSFAGNFQWHLEHSYQQYPDYKSRHTSRTLFRATHVYVHLIVL